MIKTFILSLKTRNHYKKEDKYIEKLRDNISNKISNSNDNNNDNVQHDDKKNIYF